MSAHFLWLQQLSLLHTWHVTRRNRDVINAATRFCVAPDVSCNCLETTGAGGQGERVPLKMMRPYNMWRRPIGPAARLPVRLMVRGVWGRATLETFGGHASRPRTEPHSQPTQAVKRTLLLLVGAASVILAQPSAYGHCQRFRYVPRVPPRVTCGLLRAVLSGSSGSARGSILGLGPIS